MAGANSEYKPKMTKMRFCPSSEDEEDWGMDEEAQVEVEDSVQLNDDGNGNAVTKTGGALHLQGDKKCYDDNEDKKDCEVALYENLEGITINLNMLVEFPTAHDLKFETSCATCEMQVGPPVNCCSAGHVICDLCLKRGRVNCGATILVSPQEGVTKRCRAEFIGIDFAIQNTCYYKEFMKSCRYNCGFKSVGCDVVLSGMEIVQHELLECPYRFIKYCGFRSEGCTSTFKDLEQNVQHLISEHDLPVQWSSQANFNMKHNPRKLLEVNGCSLRDVPYIRACMGASDKHFLCLLITENVDHDKTRLWILKAFCENDNRFTAVIRLYHPSKSINVLENTITMQLGVTPEVENLLNLTESTDGCVHYVDLDNKVLDNYSVEKNGEDYYGLMVVIVERIKKIEPVNDTRESFLQNLQEKLFKMEKLRIELEAIPLIKSYKYDSELDEESERRDRLKMLRGEIEDAKCLINSLENDGDE